MTRRAPINTDPIRAPLEQPPLFYRDGRRSTDEERGIVKAPEQDPAPASQLRDPFADITPMSWKDMLLPAVIVGVITIGVLVLRVSVIGLVLALGTFGALAKLR